MKLKISEIIGPVTQGEGQFIGTPAIFIRAFGCDYSCLGCDTRYAREGNDFHELSADEIADIVKQNSGGYACLVVLTGGNPCLQDFSELLLLLAGRNYTTAIETQGSIAPTWLSDLDYLTLSPKAPSTGKKTEITSVISCIDAFGKHRNYSVCIKIVVGGHTDLDYAEQMFAGLRNHYGHTGMTFCVQPFNSRLNPAIQELKTAYIELAIEVMRRKMFHIQVLPQLHVFLYGNKRGV